MAESLTQKWVANAKVGKSDYERASAGTRGNDEDALIVVDRVSRTGGTRRPLPASIVAIGSKNLLQSLAPETSRD